MTVFNMTADDAARYALSLIGDNSFSYSHLPDGLMRLIKVGAEASGLVIGAEAEITFVWTNEGYQVAVVTVSGIAGVDTPSVNGAIATGIGFGTINDLGGWAFEAETSLLLPNVSYIRPSSVPQGNLGEFARNVGGADWADAAALLSYAQEVPPGFSVFRGIETTFAGVPSAFSFGVELGYSFVIPKQPTPEGSFWELEGFPVDPVAPAPTIGEVLEHQITTLPLAGFVALARPGGEVRLYDSSGNLAYNTLSAELSGLAALDLGVFSGTGVEGFVPSALWPADIQWD